MLINILFKLFKIEGEASSSSEDEDEKESDEYVAFLKTLDPRNWKVVKINMK